MRTPRQNALLFLVWRYGKSVNWNCTHAEIARATNISERTVRAICKKHNYVLAGEAVQAARNYTHVPPAVDTFMMGSFVKNRTIY